MADINITQQTGKQIVGNVTRWGVPETSGLNPSSIQHLAGRDTQDDLIVFYWTEYITTPSVDIKIGVVNVSQITGQKIASPLTSWQTPNGSYIVEHLAGHDQNGNLLVFYWQPDGQDWRVVNVSQITGQKIASPLTSWQTSNGPYIVEHLAGHDRNGNLLVFYWQPDGQDWRVVNVSQIK